MPRKPKHPCARHGCPNFADKTYCTEHEQKYIRHPDSNKHYGRAWKRIRDRYVAAHPLCELCQKEGRLVPMDEVHHKLPISQGGSNDEHNLMSLCQSCHTKLHHEIGDRGPRQVE